MIDQLLSTTNAIVQQEISALLPVTEDRLAQAMRYSALSSGKKLRPFMLISAADMFKVERRHSLRAAAAIEIVHSYSLIHDDLPAMDDDDYRRGNLSCHKKFDEATAILAGDSLLTLAFAILADPATHPDSNIRCNLIQILAENIGSSGMAGGQMDDLLYEREILANYPQMVNMHWMKTARLFMASCSMGSTLGSASLEAQQHLIKYAEFFGLAFQFIDDLEDVAENKLLNNNIVQLIGYEETKIATYKLIEQARAELNFFSGEGDVLDLLARQLIASI